MHGSRSRLQARFVSIAAIFFFGICFIPCGLAQDKNKLVSLTDEIIQRMIPVMQAMVDTQNQHTANLVGVLNALDKANKAGAKISEEIESGRDILDVCKSLSNQLAFPENLSYVPKLSKELTKYYGPTALFSFGFPTAPQIAAAWKLLLSDPHNPEYVANWFKVAQIEAPEIRKTGEALKATAAFYKTHQYKSLGTFDGLRYFWDSPDQIINVEFDLLNLFSGLEKTTGEEIATGPILQIRASVKMEKAESHPVEDLVPAALAKAGMTKEAFDSYYLWLIAAYTDSKHPERVQPFTVPTMPEGYPPDKLEEIKKGYEEINAIQAIHRANLEVYNRHAQTLDPFMQFFVPEQK
jgi:hypothetical protein